MTNRQTILIAGATRNIGGGATLAFAKRETRVVVLGHRLKTSEAKADSLHATLPKEEIESQDKDFTTFVVDFSDVKLVRSA